jgi:hypothetical protein
MAYLNGVLSEIRLHAEGMAGVLAVPSTLRLSPGQYLLASSEAAAEAMPVVLFPTSLPGEELTVAPPLPTAWAVGTVLHLHGPLGAGFHLPDSARRVALACLDASPAVLLALARLALQKGAAVTLYASRAPEGLPEAVEVLPLEMLAEALSWADYIAAVFPYPRLAELRRLAGLAPHQTFSIDVEGLVLVPMPCGGLGGCGACAVLTRNGWKQACSDGPVFPLNQLEVS